VNGHRKLCVRTPARRDQYVSTALSGTFGTSRAWHAAFFLWRESLNFIAFCCAPRNCT
jgi:hypothetical protein